MAESWGRFPKTRAEERSVQWASDPLPLPSDGRRVLPHGLGRSYGDSCLNDGGVLLMTRPLDRLLGFNAATGLLRCEAGVTLAEILRVFVPRGWFLPVTPGTKIVTVGGAIANDVHGKNHHKAGTFGRHVPRFELLRSDGTRFECSDRENAGLYRATIGGLGLTGLITWAEVQLIPVESPRINMESIRFGGLDEFFDVSAASARTHDYSVAWIDCLARGQALGRGIFMHGNHAPAETDTKADTGNEPDAGAATQARGSVAPRHEQIPFPIDAPGWLLNAITVRAFNAAYWCKQWRARVSRTIHYDPFFYPLDAIARWNRLYGPAGFLQHQCVVPFTDSRDAIRSLLQTIADARQGSFLAVLKTFGDAPSPGLLSFPRPGVTLALDFPNRGARTFALLDKLDEIVRDAGGAVYPAKDARMSSETFHASFPAWNEFAKYMDPHFSSSFSRRVAGA